MPLYTLRCPVDGCTHTTEVLVKNVEEADDTDERCPEHPEVGMIRVGVEGANFREGFIAGAYLENGQFVRGHFGREARRVSGRKRVL